MTLIATKTSLPLATAHSPTHAPANRLLPWMWLATALFATRVCAQYLELVWPAAPLPGFERWSSGVIGYPGLFLIQCLMLWGMATLNRNLHTLRRSLTVGACLISVASVYFSLMLLRFIVSVFELSALPWFQLPLPSFFHMVLAVYIGLLGCYHSERSAE